MDINTSSLDVSHEEECCRKIRENWDQLNLLALGLAKRSLPQRRRIREAYLVMYDEELSDHLLKAQVANQNNEVYGALHLWMLEAKDRDAFIARNAIKNIDTEYMALVEIYTCRKSSQIFLINQAYQEKFKQSLNHDLLTDPPHAFQKILMALATSHKSHQTDISDHIAKCDAKRLHEARHKMAGGGLDEDVILEMLSKRSIPQLKLTLSSYKRIYGHNYKKSIKKDSSKELEVSFRAAIECMYNPPKYFAKMLYMNLKDELRDKSTLTRVMVSRAEVDMEDIKREFKIKYQIKLHDAICEEIHVGDYRDFLVALTNTPKC